MIRPACILAIFAFPAWAEVRSDKWQPNLESYAHMVPVDASPCEYEVTIYNYDTDNKPLGSGSLWVGDFHVGIGYILNVGPMYGERFIIFPPNGWIAVPSDFTVRDEQKQVVQICRYVGF